MLNRILSYLNYRISAQTKYDIHSPFIFDLVTNVLNSTASFYVFDKIEFVRKQYLNDHTQIEVLDLGAGSATLKNNKRSVSAICKTSAKSPKYAQLLFRLVNYFKPQVMLELGTSLGISSLYMASGSSAGKLITLEGAPEVLKIASKTFNLFGATNINVVQGNFDETLETVLCEHGKIDFVYMDGNHRYEPTLRYFEQCLKSAHSKTVFVFDDIYWSDEMMKAWEQIKKHPSVRVTVDLYALGLVFLNPDLSKQDFVIKY